MLLKIKVRDDKAPATAGVAIKADTFQLSVLKNELYH